jgi:hypothetical protein
VKLLLGDRALQTGLMRAAILEDLPDCKTSLERMIIRPDLLSGIVREGWRWNRKTSPEIDRTWTKKH